MNWENLREEEFKGAIEKSGGLCVLPMGCLEKHGQHIPVGTDSIKSIAIVEQASELEEVMVFPLGMWLGDLTCAHSYKDPISQRDAGYIALKPTTVLTVLEELCDEIARNGFHKILIVNSHGGNTPLLNYFLRCQTYETKNYATMVVDARDQMITKTPYPYFVEHRSEYPMLTDADMEVLRGFHERGGFGGGHADFSETACIMGVRPDLVAPDRYEAESGMSTHRSDYLQEMGVSVVNAWSVNCPNAFSGYPSTGCTQAIGQAMLTYSARRLAKIFKVIKEDEDCVRIAQNLPPLA